jgi:hypothetical protein
MNSKQEDNLKSTNVYAILTKSDDDLVKQFEDNGNDLELITSSGDRTLFNRMFGTLTPGSLRATIFAMSTLALGPGCLSLPQRFENMSLALALIMMAVSAVASYWSLTLLLKAGNALNTHDYSKLIKQVVGTKVALLFDINILIYIYGVLISFQCISKYN